MLSRPTVRRILVRAGLTSYPRQLRSPLVTLVSPIYGCLRKACRCSWIGATTPDMEDRGPMVDLACWRWTTLPGRHPMPYSKNRRTPGVILYFFASWCIIPRRAVPSFGVYRCEHAVFQPRRCPSKIQVPASSPERPSDPFE